MDHSGEGRMKMEVTVGVGGSQLRSAKAVHNHQKLREVQGRVSSVVNTLNFSAQNHSTPTIKCVVACYVTPGSCYGFLQCWQVRKGESCVLVGSGSTVLVCRCLA